MAHSFARPRPINDSQYVWIHSPRCDFTGSNSLVQFILLIIISLLMLNLVVNFLILLSILNRLMLNVMRIFITHYLLLINLLVFAFDLNMANLFSYRLLWNQLLNTLLLCCLLFILVMIIRMLFLRNLFVFSGLYFIWSTKILICALLKGDFNLLWLNFLCILMWLV